MELGKIRNWSGTSRAKSLFRNLRSSAFTRRAEGRRICGLDVRNHRANHSPSTSASLCGPVRPGYALNSRHHPPPRRTFSPIGHQQPTTTSQLIPPNPTIKNFLRSAITRDTQLLIIQPRLHPIAPSRRWGESLLERRAPARHVQADAFEPSWRSAFLSYWPVRLAPAPTLRGGPHSITVSG
jgi:hypothetical protein